MSSISDLVKQGYDTITHPGLGGNGRLKLMYTNKETGGYGVWVEVHDDATDAGVLDPPVMLVMGIPQDDKYEPWVEV